MSLEITEHEGYNTKILEKKTLLIRFLGNRKTKLHLIETLILAPHSRHTSPHPFIWGWLLQEDRVRAGARGGDFSPIKRVILMPGTATLAAPGAAS